MSFIVSASHLLLLIVRSRDTPVHKDFGPPKIGPVGIFPVGSLVADRLKYFNMLTPPHFRPPEISAPALSGADVWALSAHLYADSQGCFSQDGFVGPTGRTQ